MSATRRLVILGATGTVGVQTLRILEQADSPLEVVALSAHGRGEEMAALAEPLAAARTFLTSDPDQSAELLDFLRSGDFEICLNAVVGAAGLPYSEAVLSAGCDLALANKESLVLAGELLTNLARTTGAEILPVDSEHAAIHQCLLGADPTAVRRLYLTASGGALRDLPIDQLSEVTPERIRGTTISFYQLMVTVGILAAFVSNAAFSYIESWRWMFGVLVIPAILLFVGALSVPNSPRWLAARDRFDEARDVLSKLRLNGVDLLDAVLVTVLPVEHLLLDGVAVFGYLFDVLL